ncbi:FAD-dependent oxidoreductase [Paenibacillus cymbidii]|uniref:FAD-dependent oxidoreductase n=1 Tax=Paenibacillus cymbidii TaxID=1639034 RepID=UPI001081EA94|nr:FAD-dependent oxidoreductase [Paenibacillus cymbidii]
MQHIDEQLQTAIAGQYDVIVAGAGPAGVAAAIRSARSGARTALFEVAGCLGGVWTAGMLAWVFDFDQAGFSRELTRELDRRGARRGTNPDKYVYEIEAMKLLLEEMCAEAGVTVQLHTRVVAATKDGSGRLRNVITESKSGRQAWSAAAFVDCTGDGDLGALAGNGFDYGLEGTGETQPMTFMALVNVKDAAAIKEYISFYEGDLDKELRELAWQGFLREINRAGLEPSYMRPTLFHIRDQLVAIMVNHEYGVTPFDEAQVTAATLRARREVSAIVDALRALGGVWEGIQLVASADQIGVRDGRRLHGRYKVTRDDIVAGARHEDAAAYVKFGVDVHSFSKEKNRHENGLSNYGIKSKPYDIPLRALIARDVDGLLMAGRCISGDYIAHSSYRVTGNSVATGEAAGAAAALSAASGVLPHELAWPDVRRLMDREDA